MALIFEPLPNAKLVLGRAEEFGFLLGVLIALDDQKCRLSRQA